MTTPTITIYNTTNSLYSYTWNSSYANYNFQQLLSLEFNNLANYNYNTNLQANTYGGTYGYNLNNQFYVTTVSGINPYGFTDLFLGSTSQYGSNVTSIVYQNKFTGATMTAYGSFTYSGLPYISTLTSGTITTIAEVYSNGEANLFKVNATYQGNGVFNGNLTNALSGKYDSVTKNFNGLDIDGNVNFSVNVFNGTATVYSGGTLSSAGFFQFNGSDFTNLTTTDYATIVGNPSFTSLTTPLNQLTATGNGFTYNLQGTLGNIITPYGSGDTFIIHSANNTINALGNSNVAVFDGNYSQYNLSTSGNQITVTDQTPNRNGVTYLNNIQLLQFSNGTNLPVFVNSSNNQQTYLLPTKFTGPVSLGLNWQLINNDDNAVITGSSENEFIKVASTNSIGKAVNGGGGTDVIDGGVGSTFVSGGGSGATTHSGDTFFLDGRAPGTSWSTITDFKFSSDQATIWGFVKGVSSVDMNPVFSNPNNEGAIGYKGLTLHFDNLLPDGQASGTNLNMNSITLSGHTLADIGVSSLQDLNNQIAQATIPNAYNQYIVNGHILIGQTFDVAGTHGYLFIH